jgi:hypothetical protein
MTTPIKPLNQSAKDAVHDQRTALVKDLLSKESAERDARTIRLRALRLAKEAEDRAAAANAPVEAAPKRTRKKQH